jgi:hypothetical protein
MFCGEKAQVSLEYLLLLAAFFSAFAVLLPVISDSAKNFLYASDVVLAKRISSEVTEQVSLMAFLGDGSAKKFEYFPSKSIVVFSRGNGVVFSAQGKEFFSDCGSPQLLVKQEFEANFSVSLSRDNGRVVVSAESS